VGVGEPVHASVHRSSSSYVSVFGEMSVFTST
jgi:hypothetical protein